MTEHRGVRFSVGVKLPVALSSLRSSIVMLLLFSAFLALMVRAFWLQAITRDFLKQQGEARYARTIELPAMRGKMVDRNGVSLASTLPSKSIWADPELLKDASAESMKELSSLLGMAEAQLHGKLASARNFVYLKRQVDAAQAEKINKLGIEGVESRNDYRRYYPQGEAATHVVGFTNVEDQGQDGMELQAQKTLVGKVGSRRVIKDRLGRVVEEIGDVLPPKPGHDLSLSIDADIQYLAFTKLKDAVETHHAKAGGAIVVDVQTGEILALVNLPSYDPNFRASMTGDQLRNRVVTDTFEPGSTLKPFAVALALEEHVVTPETLIQTSPGKLKIGTATISDSHAHGLLTTAQVIQKSSNIGTAKIALQLTPKAMWTTLTDAGFGRVPHIGFPGTVTGRVRPYQKWRPIEQATISYGHGISVSLLQLAQAYTIFARQGDVIPLSILKTTGLPASKQVFSPDTAQIMRDMLETVVSEEGTAPKAKVPGFRVGGKTGTAYKVENGRYVQKYVASFVGIAPISHPRIIVAVMIDEPHGGHFGGDVAAPVFSDVTGAVLRSMQVPFDAPIEETQLEIVDTKKGLKPKAGPSRPAIKVKSAKIEGRP
jgi:cell division protein FtsI (penicillin-binding protein 3)